MKTIIALIAAALITSTLTGQTASAELYQISLSQPDALSGARDQSAGARQQTLYIDTTDFLVHLPVPNECHEGLPCLERTRYSTFQISNLQVHEGQLIRVFATSKNSEIEISTYRDLSTRVVIRDNNTASEAHYLGSPAETVRE